MSPAPESLLVCTGFLTLVLASCMQLPISKAALRLEEQRAAASRTHTFAVTANVPPQPSTAMFTRGQDLVTLHGYVFSSASSATPESDAPLVVFVERTEDADRTELDGPPVPMPVAKRSTEASAPTFVVTSPGLGVRFENTDDICHSFFSSSGPNAFDLGVLNPGQSKQVSFAHEGFVQVYCTLHAGKHAGSRCWSRWRIHRPSSLISSQAS